MRTWICVAKPAWNVGNALWVELGDGRLLRVGNEGDHSVVSGDDARAVLESLRRNTGGRWEPLE